MKRPIVPWHQALAARRLTSRLFLTIFISIFIDISIINVISLLLLLCIGIFYAFFVIIATHFISSANAIIPAASGAEAEVPVCLSVHVLCKSVVT